MDVDHYASRGLDCVCGNLRMASRAVTSVYDSHLRPIGIQASQLAVLWAVAGMPDSTVKDIARRIAMDETALLRNLRVLEARGWVAMDVGEDRRQRLPTLTDDGRDIFGRALPVWQRAQAQVAAVLDGTLKQMNSQLIKLTRAVS
ncbi:MarR family winged helix-turn-helix transcriptional regulator [Piscinibacter terrae]|uniref:MarR family transcriptional regulator n=1 Tax=Piscinibacter terrae TaxID=2496871 RepID=A0A3N7HXX0_9BURK|nr:MarR family winged helix-turn-helix transcriptional regulator [Albitalea terrae]RQP25911.1 MarR family transcriptional regulator [Albitalea terrae]